MFLEFSHLKPNKTVKLSLVTLYMTFEKILKDFKVSSLAKTQVCLIAYLEYPSHVAYSKPQSNFSEFLIAIFDKFPGLWSK